MTERIRFEAQNLIDTYGRYNAQQRAAERLSRAQWAFNLNPSAANYTAQDWAALVYQYIVKQEA